MADYYTRFVFRVEVEEPEVLWTRLVELVAEVVDNDYVADEDHPIFGNWDDEVFGLPHVEIVEGGLEFEDDAGESSVGVTGAMVAWVLTQNGTPNEVTFLYADTCSKARLGGFGGGLVKARSGKYVHLWLGDDDIAELADRKLAE